MGRINVTKPAGKRKRSDNELVSTRARIAELALQYHTQQEIADILHKETGIELSRRQIGADIAKIRDEWKAKTLSSYDELIQEELLRLDVLEKKAWEAYNHVNTPHRSRVTRISNGDEGDVAQKTVAEEIQHVGDPTILDQIMKIQAERRKLLGLYPGTRKDVNQTINIKGYTVVASPDNWPRHNELPSLPAPQVIIDSDWDDDDEE